MALDTTALTAAREYNRIAPQLSQYERGILRAALLEAKSSGNWRAFANLLSATTTQARLGRRFQ